jgi:hypothetical protein
MREKQQPKKIDWFALIIGTITLMILIFATMELK